jgi:pimeloyl-ACP methyl ester carboxylesterase
MRETSRGIAYRVDDLTPPWRSGARPVLLMHGIGTHSDAWGDWVPVLAGDRPVIRLDMRGWGRSDVLTDGQADLDLLVEDLWDVVDETGVTGPVHLAGESLGGTVVLAAAIARAERTASVQMFNAGFRGDALGEVGNWTDQFAGGVDAWAARMMKNRFAPDIPLTPALEWFERTQRETDPATASALGAMLRNTDLSEGLAGLTVPVTLVLPDGSPFVPVAHGLDATLVNPRIALKVVPGTRHGLPYSHAEQEAAQMRDRLRRIDAGG